MSDTPEKNLTPNPNLSILCVEDSPLDRTYLAQQLQALGYETDFAPDGIEALNSVLKKHYDIILMDMYMPELGGIDTIEKIRYFEKKHGKEEAYIVGITAFVQKGTEEKCLAAGANQFLNKPVEKEKLNAILQKCSQDKVAH